MNQPPESPEQRFVQLTDPLPPAPKPIGNYVPCKQVGDLLYLSGHGPLTAQKTLICGVVGESLSVEQAYQAARITGLGILQTIRRELGTLDAVAEVVRTFGMMRAAGDFTQHAQVIDGCSDLFAEIFDGDSGRSSRCAVGMGSLPQGIVVEIETIFRLHA